jgi:hypothetical protein
LNLSEEVSEGIAPDPQQETPKTYEGDINGLKEAARDLREERGAPDDGELLKPPGPARSVTAEGAAHELSEWRREQAEAAEQSAKDDFALKVDLARAGFHSSFEDLKTQEDINRLAAENPERFAEFQKHVIRTATQSEVQPETPVDAPTPGIDPEVHEALSRPKVRQVFEKVLANVEQQQNQFTEATAVAAQVSHAALFANYPELQGLNAQQLDGALAVMAKQDPARYTEITARINQTVTLAQAAQQSRAREVQLTQARIHDWQKQQDAAFDGWAAKNETPEGLKRVKDSVLEIAKDEYGLTRDDLAQAWNNNPILHSVEFQRVLFDATRYQLAKRGMKEGRHAPLSPVQRPGVAPLATDVSDDTIRELRSQLKKARGMESVRIAARLQGLERLARG